jgi:hypothetical protein
MMTITKPHGLQENSTYAVTVTNDDGTETFEGRYVGEAFMDWPGSPDPTQPWLMFVPTHDDAKGSLHSAIPRDHFVSAELVELFS